MKRKCIIGLVVVFAVLLASGTMKSFAQEPPAPGVTTYEAKVTAVRQSLAAERKALDLSTTSGQLATPESDLGAPDCQNVGASSGSGGGSASTMGASVATRSASCMPSSQGAPVWQVNMVNLNFHMADTPLWYSSPIGPSVELKLSYNAQTSLSGPFGSKWQLNYRSYLYRAADNNGAFAGIMVVMPDGKQQLYVPDGAGGYSSPYHAFNTLAELAQTRFELRFPDGKAYVYDIPQGTTASVSLLTEMRDAYGQKLTMGYDANGRLTTITDALGKVTTLSYNGDGLVIQAADPFGRTASFEYDVDKNLAKITDMGGYWTSFTYHSYLPTDYYLAGLTNAAGSWGFYFEPADGSDNGGVAYPAPETTMGSNYRITVTNPSDGREEYYRTGSSAWYVRPGDYVPYTDGANNNSAGNVPKTLYTYFMTAGTKGEIGSIQSPEGSTTTYTYDNTGNMTGLSNGLTYFLYTYNAQGKVTSIANQADINHAVTNLTYGANGMDLIGITASSTTNGITTSLGTIALTYNNAHDITSYTDRSGNTKTVTYNGYGQIESMTDPLGTTTNHIYDANHRLTQVTRSGQVLNSRTYDTVGRVRTSTDASDVTRTYDYSNLNDITKITYPDGKYTGTTYSSVFPHLVTSTTDRGGKTTQYVYDAFKKMTRIVNPAGGITRMAYDVNGNRIQLIDPNDRVTGFAYDRDNRLVRKTFADGTFISYTHDGAGRLVSTTGARNLSTSFGFDLNNNLANVTYTNDLTHPEYYTSPSIFQYDPYRRRIRMDDAAGTTLYSYNADSLLTSIDGPLANDTLTYQYDKNGRMTGYSLQQGQSVTYTYDTLDRITAIQGSAGIFSYTYSGASPLIQRLTRPNGSYTDYQYDAMNRLILVANRKSSGETISQYGYAYNAQDRRASENITDGAPVAAFNNQATTYNYNNVNALLGTANPPHAFTYDADGNTTQWDSPAGKTLIGVYDIENRLTSVGYQIISGMQTESYNATYKYRGNGMAAEKGAEYSKAIIINNASNYEYYKKTVKYVGHGLLPLQEREELKTTINAVRTTTSSVREYTWGKNLGGGIGGLLSMGQGGQNYFTSMTERATSPRSSTPNRTWQRPMPMIPSAIS